MKYLIDDDEFKRRYKQKAKIFRKTIIDVMNLRSRENISWGTIIERNAREFSNNVAIKFEDITLTYKEFNERTNQYAHFFISQGMKKGDVVRILMPNRPEYLLIVGACAKIGAIASLINIDLRRKSLEHCLKLTPGRFTIVDEACFNVFNEISLNLNLSSKHVLFFLPNNGLIPSPKKYINLTEFINDYSTGNPQTTSHVKASDHFLYIFTSGTTGLPKATVLIHRRIIYGTIVYKEALVGISPKDTIYIALPFFHSTPIGIGWSAACSNGAAIAIGRKFSVSRFWDEIRKYNATIFIYVGEVCRYLMNQPPSPDDLNNSVSKIIGNGLRPDIWVDFKKRFGITTVGEFYGASEGGGGFYNFFNFDNTVGYCPTPYAIVKYDIEEDKPIRNKEGFMEKVNRGETGLLLFQNQLGGFIGYTDKKETEKKLFRDVFKKGDVWINTGDLLLDQGNRHALFIDRIGDTFRWKAHNISTTELEELINQFEDVLISAVYGVKIPGTDGRAGMATIIPKNSIKEFKFEQLFHYFKKNLAHYAIPIFLRFKENLHLTVSYKLKKSILKQEGFNIESIKDPIYVLLPGDSKYVLLTRSIHKNILEHEYKF